MNEIFIAIGIERFKPLFSALLLPPFPLLALMLAGAWAMHRRRALAWPLVLAGVVGLWLSTTPAAGDALTSWLDRPPRALGQVEIASLVRAPRTAIIVLGGGGTRLAPEVGGQTLHPRSVERLRYGIWLARQTALPLGYSGGLGHGAKPGVSEAESAGRIAAQEFGLPLRWQEARSRDTHENALRTVALLQPLGIERIVLVTHGYHMRRALANFERAAQGLQIQLVAAPMGLPEGGPMSVSDWLPSASGFESTRIALHEWLGRLAGA